MTCRDIESLILAERDGALTPAERAALSDHVAACPACREFRSKIGTALDTYRTGVSAVPAPDAGEAWREFQATLHAPARPAKKRPLAPVIWFGTPLAAAAAVAFAFFVARTPPSPLDALPAPTEIAAIAPPPPPPPPFVAPPAASSLPLHDPSLIAGADFVEAGDPNASTMVYVDKESGWLVVWVSDGEPLTSG